MAAAGRRRGAADAGAHYTVQNVGQPSGTITITTGAEIDDEYVILGAMTAERITTFPGFRSLPNSRIEAELDSLQKQLQELKREIARAVR
ncbi:hypothetical protein ACO2I3_06405 [Leptospira interrogans]